ncbi:hypothetical protein [Sulfurospirillum sp. UCH001]|uniref:hypothetical protein n=1 Tax=Sulfurospirillum sp. UCH001 TaxID=1581011 RepID=UPI0008314DC7|nr:hypothetical protein [Sulfurospirillum sp. UCH001]
MYCFLNYFAFEKAKEGINDSHILQTLRDIFSFSSLLHKHSISLIINQNLLNTYVKGDLLKNYLLKIEEADIRRALLSKFTNYHPFCSDTYDAYGDNEVIMLGNCHELSTKIDIIGNFLACAMYNNSSIVTPDKLCSREAFFGDKINISCEHSQYELYNFCLSKHETMLLEYLENKHKAEYANISTWQEYQNYVNSNFKYVEILNDCISTLLPYAWGSIQQRNVLEDISNINTFIEANGGNPLHVNFSKLGKHINEETSNKQSKRKHRLTKKDKDNNSIILSWHTRIGDYRLYFYLTDSKVYFVFFTPKIPD